MKRLYFLSLVVVLILILSLVACSSIEGTQSTGDGSSSATQQEESNVNNDNIVADKDTQVEENSQNNEREIAEQKNSEDELNEENIPKYRAPLTGLPVEQEVDGRIIGIMINNHYKARPQSGLNKADMVYEILAEGMITRFVAIYHSQQPDVIGPVRSIRPYYLDIINGFDALIVHAGASNAAFAILQQNQLPDIDEITNSGGAFWRATFRKAPHNVYTNIEKIKDIAKRRGFRLKGYIPTIPFLGEDEKVEGIEAKEIKIEYYSKYVIDYKYDEETKLYNRYVNGAPHKDLETDEQLTARNILVIRTDHKIIDDVGRREIDVNGPGKGYLFQNGIVKEITWQRKDGIIRAYIDGKEQGLYPGQTWIIVVQNQTPVFYQ
ncbi:hypothetical protein BHF71_08880 [Vulcanibacillus modesticaldus]|uniref:Lipoprotein YerB n=1 Tax=Vulcanibacillus modesticaldus TaxID=337097 RepID=A0A1D2YUV4_9BACI|nr:DUF3048 domain-containing protein [Vulcanibacillus modesticaldus]OEF99467.1 hypothetical protein BHF71_08880 [Vulcanibacillus modesticaldus]